MAGFERERLARKGSIYVVFSNKVRLESTGILSTYCIH